MGVGIAIALGVTAAASAGMQAYSANKAGKDAQKASGAAASRFEETGRMGSDMLKKYEKLLSNPDAILGTVNAVNDRNRGSAEAQARSVNTFNQSELDRMMQFALPGYKKLINTALTNTKSWLKGEVPDDVTAFVQNRTAEQSNRLGMPATSGNARALVARDLGRTSLDLMSQGENSLQRWIGTARQNLVPTLHDPMEFLFTPTQLINTTLSAANVANQRAGILTGSQNAATNALLQGDQAKIASDQAMYAAIAQGIESIGGAVAGGMSAGGAGASGAGGVSAQGIPNAGAVQGMNYSPNIGYYGAGSSGTNNLATYLSSGALNR